LLNFYAFQNIQLKSIGQSKKDTKDKKQQVMSPELAV